MCVVGVLFYCALPLATAQERRMQQQREALLKEKEAAEKIAARAFAQSYLSDLVPSVFGTLSESGFFYDPVERGILSVASTKNSAFTVHVPLPYRSGDGVCSVVDGSD